MEIDIKTLHPLEVKLLCLPERSFTSDSVTLRLGLKAGQANQAVSWLLAKGLIQETGREKRILYELTDTGDDFRVNGTPDEKMIRILSERGPMLLPELAEAAGIEAKDAGSAFGQLSREGILAMDGDKRVVLKSTDVPPRLIAVRKLLERASKEGAIAEGSLSKEEASAMAGISKKRGAAGSPFKVIERETVSYEKTEEGMRIASILEEKHITGEEIGALTPEILASGSWRDKPFRSYNIKSPSARLLPGRLNPYGEFLAWVKDKLASLGFEEFDGPLVETEFWNGDALFMPQFHSARDIHDVYYVKEPMYAKSIEEPFLSQVAAVHENGWKTGSRGWEYSFDRDFTRRLILRSQGTVLSAKTLPKAKIPGKYFGVVRCFRYDQVDATHGADFYQTEGIVLGEDVNLRTLLGLLKMFAEEVAGAEDVKYVPGYFPFTEPSIEVHIKHPVLGWFELGGSGIFRPEVTEPLGVHVPVLAWGLGIDRMALMHLGLSDLRELFSSNIENVRLRRSK
ncbi:MAG TPA: phenylalanine--tRNA ligase subunit alpha [Spirochaetia bacterium]|nr:phenylalanine--tRNA ligase subunit alpha [Spirochaetia bacterium]